MEKYFCIFKTDKECPVKKEYKLQPESLVKFCGICSHTPSKANEKMVFNAFMHFVSSMGDLQRQLGHKTAEAEIYKELYQSKPPEG